MTAKPTEAPQARSTPTTAVQTGRKPWKKKTPVEVMLDQIDKLREVVATQEEDLKRAKRQLQKLEEARKVLESA